MEPLVVLAVILVAVAPGSAYAGPWRDHARRVAHSTFAAPPCGEPRIIRRDPRTYAGGAQADWLRHATAWADPERCAIVLSSRERIRTLWRFCHVVSHEWGHLAGYEHSDDPGDVMYEHALGVEGEVRRHGRWRWVADQFYAPCEPRKIMRHGRAVIGVWTT